MADFDRLIADFDRPPTKAPAPGPEEKRVLRFLDRLEDESKTVEKGIKESWDSNLAWFRGQQWMLPDRKPLFMANKLGQIIRKRGAKLVEMKPQFQTKARRQGLSNTEMVLQKTIDAGWDEYSIQMVLEQAVRHMDVYGVTFLHIPWDAAADYGEGDIVPGCLDPRFVHLDPALQNAEDLDMANYIWTSSYISTWEMQKRWPGRGLLVPTADTTGGDQDWLSSHLKKMFAAWKKGSTPPPQAIPRSELREYWFNDPATDAQTGLPLYPCGRHIIRGGSDVILTDEPNPYHDERWPIVMVDGNYDPEHPWGLPEVRALRYLQDAINRMGHLFVENSVVTGNTWVVADEDAFRPAIVERLNSIGALFLPKKRGYEVNRETPPPMPPHMMGFIAQAMAWMDELAGLSDPTAAAEGRVEVRSADQLEGIQQATEVLIRATGRRLEAGLERLGQRWIARIFQFYTHNRMLAQLGPTLEWQTFEFERQELVKEIDAAVRADAAEKARRGEVTQSLQEMYSDATKRAWRYFTFRITPGSSLASVRAARAQLHGALAERGMLSKKYVLQDLGYPNPQQEIDEAYKEKLADMAAMQGPPAAPEAAPQDMPPLRRAV
jgi:hypothetical protein